MKRWTLGFLCLAALPAVSAAGCVLARDHACSADADCAGGNVCAAGSCRPRPCAADADCGLADACVTHQCAAGACRSTFAPEGPIAAADQTPGDCAERFCDGDGHLAERADPNDVPPDDGNPCTNEVCDAHGGAHVLAPSAQACTSASLTGVCDGAGACVECVTDANCASGAEPRCDSAAHACITCDNGVADGDELGVDCGGACPLKCTLQDCSGDAECASGHCGDNGLCRLINNQPCTANAQCLSFHCVGAPSAKTCQACGSNNPCTSGVCMGGVCSSP